MEIAKVLTIAGSDCSGGAGIQADLKTFAAYGCYGASVITSVVAENTQRVISVCNIPADEVGRQLDAVFEDIPIAAVKLGMLPTAEIIETVAAKLRQYRPPHIVCDPVLVATSGDALSDSGVIPAYVEHIFPLAEIITPNIPEAEAFTGIVINEWDDIENAAWEFRELGAASVLIKGGHLDGKQAVDFLIDRGVPRVIRAARVDSPNTHGTGCTLSSAIAAGLARGDTLFGAVRYAKLYVTRAIESSYTVGQGHSPVNHFFEMW